MDTIEKEQKDVDRSDEDESAQLEMELNLIRQHKMLNEEILMNEEREMKKVREMEIKQK